MGNPTYVRRGCIQSPGVLPRQPRRNAAAIFEMCRAKSGAISLVRASAKPKGYRALACLLTVGATLMASEQ